MRKQITGVECIVENPGQSNVVILFHGYGADYTDLAPLADIMDPSGEWTWVFPNGPETVDIGYHVTGRAWFPISVEDLQKAMLTGTFRDYAGSAPEGLDSILPQLEDLVEELKKSHTHIVIGGFSQGGMMASHLLAAAGEHLKGALLLSTVLLNFERLRTSLKDIPPKAFLQSHGSKDSVLPLKQGMDLFQFLKKSGWEGRWAEFSGEHEIPPMVLQKSREFLKSLL